MKTSGFSVIALLTLFTISSVFKGTRACPIKQICMEFFGIKEYDQFSRLRKIYRMVQESESSLKKLEESNDNLVGISQFWGKLDDQVLFDKIDRRFNSCQATLNDSKSRTVKAIFDNIHLHSEDQVQKILEILDLIDIYFGNNWPTLSKNKRFSVEYGKLVQDCKFKKVAF